MSTELFSSYRLDPVPAPLEALRGVHPRLYLAESRFVQLKKAISGSHRALWEKVKAQADLAVETGPPAYTAEEDRSGKEQLWQRNVGNIMPAIALAWRLTGNRAYLESAQAWATASCGYRTWGLDRLDGLELAAGHQMFGLAIIYDWCYDDLDPKVRNTIRETLIRRTQTMFEAAALEKVWWHDIYLHNHLWVKISAMAAVGIALFGEADQAPDWIGLPLTKFRRTVEVLGRDGASNEGVGYWGYGLEYLLKFLDLARTCLGVDLYDTDALKNTAYYRLYMALPEKAWTPKNNIVDIADCPRGNWYGPDYLLRHLATTYRDGHAQRLAQQLDDANVTDGSARWLNLVWFDPTLAPKTPEGLPTLRHFDDIDIVSARTNWSGGESLLVFKCGPYIGHSAIREFSKSPGGSHAHPDAGHFSLFGQGEWLIRDDGYVAKFTAHHNALIIDGKGQLGEGRTWFSGREPLEAKSCPRITHVATAPGTDHIAGNSTEAYPEALGLRNHQRHLLFLKPDVLIVADDVEMARDADLELRFFPEYAPEQSGNGICFATGDLSRLRIQLLTRNGNGFAVENVPISGLHNETGDATRPAVRITRRANHWRTAVALSWSAKNGEPVSVTLDDSGDVWTFTAGTRRVALDWASGAGK